MDCNLPGSSVHGDSPGKNTGVGCHALLQGIFPIQGLNPGLPHCRWILYHLSHQESPIYINIYICIIYTQIYIFMMSMIQSKIRYLTYEELLGFPGGSDGKGSTCNEGHPGLIPGLRRPHGERNGYPLQYSWASLVAQTVKNLPAMQETWVRSLGWEEPLEEGTATTPVLLPGESPWTEKPGKLQSMGSQRVGHNWVPFTFTFTHIKRYIHTHAQTHTPVFFPKAIWQIFKRIKISTFIKEK